MYNSPIETEFNQFLMELRNIKQDYFETLKQKVFSEIKELKRCVLINLMEHIAKDISFAVYDEQVFEIYKSIIDQYEVFLHNYNNVKENLNTDIGKNLTGIVDVLNNQICAFYEQNLHIEVNPILVEKRNLIANFLDTIYKAIENILSISYEEFISKTDDFTTYEIKTEFIKFLYEMITETYRKNLIACFYAINDIEAREIISYYNSTLEEEREILSSIIKVQIKALEDLCFNEEETEKIEGLLKPIREIYQYTNKRFDCFTQSIKNIDTDINFDIEKDKKIILEFFENNFKFICFNQVEQEKILDNFLISFIENELKENLSNIQIFKEDINNTLSIFYDVKNQFNLIFEILKNMQENEEEDSSQIIEGIFETIKIKIDNFEENEKDFLKIIEDILYNIKIIEDIDIKNFFEYDKKEILKNYNTENLAIYIKNEIFDKNFNKYFILLEKYKKSIYNFKKDIIFFEISTFEEIINYSVVRLRNSQSEDILQFVNAVDNAILNIQKIIIKKGIIIIQPKPHEGFNGKEHEIIVAEKNEEFKKGEIIKVINCGYKIFDKVVVRANVIAAK